MSSPSNLEWIWESATLLRPLLTLVAWNCIPIFLNAFNVQFRNFLHPLSRSTKPQNTDGVTIRACVCFDLPVDGITINIVTRTHSIDGRNFTFGLNVFSVPNPIYDPSLNGLFPLPRKSHVAAASFSRLCVVSFRCETGIVGFHGSGNFAILQVEM